MTKTFAFNVLVEKTGDELFHAHCLELDLVATSVTCEDAQEKMKKMIGRLVLFADEHNRLRDIFRPAEQMIWERFKTASRRIEESKRTVEDGSSFSLIQHSYGT